MDPLSVAPADVVSVAATEPVALPLAVVEELGMLLSVLVMASELVDDDGCELAEALVSLEASDPDVLLSVALC